MSQFYNDKMQKRFDNTIMRAVIVLSSLIDEYLREFTSSDSSSSMRRLPRINLYTELNGDYDKHDAGVFEWSNNMGIINRKNNTFQPENNLFDGILQVLEKKYNEFDISCKHNDATGENTLVFNSRFKPAEIVTSVDFDDAWEATFEKMVQYFLNTITTFIAEQCGKRSSDGIMSIDDVYYVTEGISMSTDDGLRVYAEVNAHLKKNGWQLGQVGNSSDCILYSDQSYYIELIKI
ncbi:MAG: hypothetical protein ACKUBY_04295 [Candidatus Moraniibacteriota bacterium]|jgi:hypothetical protein